MSEKPNAGALVWIHDPESPRVVEAVRERSCDICMVRKGVACFNPIEPDAPLPGRVIHFGRLEDRNPKKGAGDE